MAGDPFPYHPYPYHHDGYDDWHQTFRPLGQPYIEPYNALLPNIPQVYYKFNEDETFKEVMEYINSTYSAHYAEKGGVQALDFIMANSESLDFLKGNAIKYVARFGKKEGYNKKDLYKAIHYIILLYYFSQHKIMTTE